MTRPIVDWVRLFRVKTCLPDYRPSLDVGMAQDCTAFAMEDGNLVATRPIYAGKAYAKVTFENSWPQMATARPKVMDINEPDTSKSAEVVDASFTLTTA